MEHDIQGRAGGAEPATPNDAAATDTKRLTVDIPKDLHRILKVRAAEKDLTMAGLVRALVAEWVEGERR